MTTTSTPNGTEEVGPTGTGTLLDSTGTRTGGLDEGKEDRGMKGKEKCRVCRELESHGWWGTSGEDNHHYFVS